ncbi:MAG: hypothetical protein RLZZ546_3251 [Bacteroidota bacterium]|jgi:hypothetical protein
MWKIFVPIFYTTFFGLLTLTSFILDPEDIPLLASKTSRVILLTCYTLTAILMYFTIFNLKRVEIDEENIYVSNYLNTYRYKREDIENITTKNYFLFKLSTIAMKNKTKMGKNIRFIGSPEKLRK